MLINTKQMQTLATSFHLQHSLQQNFLNPNSRLNVWIFNIT